MEKFMIMKISQSIAFSLVLFASNAAFAGSDLDKQAYQISAFGQPIASQVDIVKQKIAQIEYVELSNQDRVKLNAELERHFAALESKPDDAAAVAGVNTVLKKAFADSRLVCTFEQALGSNMKKRQCMTAAARKRVYDTTQQTLQGRDRNDSVHIQGN